MKSTSWMIASLVLLGVPPACAAPRTRQHAPGTVEAEARGKWRPPRELEVDAEPPPPKPEFIPLAPSPDNVWITGHWAWEGRWVWVLGAWCKRPRPGAEWRSGYWEKRGSRWGWVRGSWQG